jgi:hypothetical protein
MYLPYRQMRWDRLTMNSICQSLRNTTCSVIANGILYQHLEYYSNLHFVMPLPSGSSFALQFQLHDIYVLHLRFNLLKPSGYYIYHQL